MSSGEQEDGPVAFTNADDGGEVEEQAHVELSNEVEGVKKDMVALVDVQYVYLSAPLISCSRVEYVLSSRYYLIYPEWS